MQTAFDNLSSFAAPVSIENALRGSRLEACDSNLLLQAVLGVNRAYLAAYGDQILNFRQVAAYQELVQRRVAGEPIAYILGEHEFYGLIFKIISTVLIPRPETELLVERALARIPLDRSCKVLELGTGSGNIALALALNRPLAHITAVDCSDEALALARQNSEQLYGTESRNVAFRKSDWYQALDGETYDLIISNPPYVASDDEHLQQGDVRYEPRLALDGGPDGLDCIRRIIRGARPYLCKQGWLLLEHGYDQAGACRDLLEQSGFAAFFCADDLSGIPRVSGGRIHRAML
ncbi:MAG TPA: peptide chain release factor N(5)-glutamine methyltransferase [Burkholderiales bacterium]|nr:peptide chain release factor N(5)-glutamine methyltransferase [Burkholderiales bacterium]